MDLSRFDGKTIAIVLPPPAHQRIVRGVALYEYEELLGNIMRIGISGENGGPEFVIRENQWEGEIVPDTQYGCDYRLSLAPDRFRQGRRRSNTFL